MNEGRIFLIKHKSFRFRLYPNKTQAVLINKTFGCVRFVYNKMLELQEKTYAETKRHMGQFECERLLPGMKAEFPFLKEVDNTALKSANSNLAAAYTAFFSGRSNAPSFHKKGYDESYTTTQSYIRVEGSCVFLPKLGWTKFAKSRKVEGRIKQAIISKHSSGRYYIAFLCEAEIQPLPTSDRTCGVDVGYRQLATLDDGTTFENPKPLHAALKKLAREQRKLSRQHKGSANWEKQRTKIARLHEHIANIRKDTLHKATTTLICENQTICIEDLDVREMMLKWYIAKLICDAGLGEFRRMLEYKAEWYGRQVVAVPQSYPSSKICSVCDHHHERLGGQAHWTCPSCGTRHNRDENAAVNIKREGLAILAARSA